MKKFILILIIFIILLQFIPEIYTQSNPDAAPGKAPEGKVPVPTPAAGAAPAGGASPAPVPGNAPERKAPVSATVSAPVSGAPEDSPTPADAAPTNFPTSKSSAPADTKSTNNITGGSILGGIIGSLIY